MDWLKIVIHTTQERSEEISDFLVDMGCGGVQIIDPNEIRTFISEIMADEYADEDLIPSDTDTASIIGYLDGCLDVNEIGKILVRYNAEVSVVSDSEWKDNWKKNYKALLIGKTILICPSWEKPGRTARRNIIYIDPGIVFGSGEHESTYMCAEALEAYIKKGDRVLDIGTGSGILAIIAAKLGASHVTAIDIDDMAVRAAKENSVINGTDTKISVLKCRTGSLGPEKFDMITANITAGVLADIRHDIRERLETGGHAILSGIISDKYDDIVKKYLEAGFGRVNEYRKKEWVTAVFDAQVLCCP
jgi:ribosomal protein L11 methyltransferase